MAREKDPKEEAIKLCSILMDEKDLQGRVGPISRQDCEQLMDTILTPLTDPNSCDIDETSEMLMQLGSMKAQIISNIATARIERIGEAVNQSVILSKAVQETVKRRFITVCGCKSQV